nr:reverse transcriptase domain-containing protein [Tanacetum cinerariifolium]GEY67983.1 reverse transcriptase domain-containing protein [Tanacetum cinerariifolium]
MNMDNTPRHVNENKIRQFRNQRSMTVVGAKETEGSQVQYDAEYNVFANERQHSEKPVEKDDSNVIPNSSNMCDNDNQADQNAEEYDDERFVLANLIANVKLDTDENKKIQKQLKKTNTSLSHELQECKSALEECKSSLEKSNRTRDRYLGALSDKEIVLLIIFIVDSGCTKHMKKNLKLLCNFIEKYLGTVRFGNDQFALILGYGDLVQGNIMIKRVYYIEGLNHNLFSTYSPSLICFLAKASPIQAWLWHRRLSHLNFDTITLISKKDILNGLPKLKYVKDQLRSSCKLSKAKRITLENLYPMDDEPMWAGDRVVAPTPGSAITILESAIEFAIKGNHLTLVKENQFDGRTKTDPHKHIQEFLGIYGMFKYRDTKNKAVRLMMFPLSLTGEAKIWLDELNEGTIETWDELRTAFISRFFPPALFDRLLEEI